MYKIYINNAPLILLSVDESDSYTPSLPQCIRGNYLGKAKFFFRYIDFMEKQHHEESEIVIVCKDVVKAFNDFASLYTIVEAGGGVVKNPKGEILMIFRRGFWDLPKGKMDPNENMMQTAAREVKEETGISHLQIERHLLNTYHTYRTGKGKRVLKVCTWFSMYTQDMQLTPQTEEDIDEARWVNLTQFLSEHPKIFSNIKDVLELYRKP